MVWKCGQLAATSTSCGARPVDTGQASSQTFAASVAALSREGCRTEQQGKNIAAGVTHMSCCKC